MELLTLAGTAYTRGGYVLPPTRHARDVRALR